MLRPEQRKMCWEQLSVPTTAQRSTADALHECGLDWNVITKPAKFEDEHREIVDVPNSKVIIREDKMIPLGVASDSYTPIQNTAGFGIIDDIVGNSDWHIDRVGILGQGERVFMVIKLDKGMTIGDDLVNKYFVGILGHDAKMSYHILIIPKRMFCTNQLPSFCNRSDSFKIRHSKNYKERMEESLRHLTNVEETYEKLEIQYNKLLNAPMTNMDFVHFINRLVPNPQPKMVNGELVPVNVTYARKKRADIHRLFEHGTGHENIRNTAWAALNAVTEYVDHSKEPGESYKEANIRMKSLMFNTGAKFKKDAFSMLIKQYG
jgi:phage/plasmid-like protein (TIGR03299 family)